MSYQHILVALDLTDEGPILLKKAVSLAKHSEAKISLIHIDVNFNQLYTGFIDINFAQSQQTMMESAQEQLKTIIKTVDYPIHDTIVTNGDFSNEIVQAIEERDIDLVICGHHQDFWSNLLSTSRPLINRTPVDMLIVPLCDRKDDEKLS